jgi:hypothetical protein
MVQIAHKALAVVFYSHHIARPILHGAIHVLFKAAVCLCMVGIHATHIAFIEKCAPFIVSGVCYDMNIKFKDIELDR